VKSLLRFSPCGFKSLQAGHFGLAPPQIFAITDAATAETVMFGLALRAFAIWMHQRLNDPGYCRKDWQKVLLRL